MLDAIADPAWATELGQFNIEINVPPRHLEGGTVADLEQEVRASLNTADSHARETGSRMVMIGILPTLQKDDVNESTLSANARYRVLNEQIFAARGEDMRIAIDGTEKLLTYADSITPEAACTSVQLHVQVSPDAFARYWNAAQAIASVQVALAANSPFLFGRQLWHETRITLFEQATDTRPDELKQQGVRPRVWFGERWITSVFDLFEENIQFFPALLPICEEEDPLAVLDQGGCPQLAEMSLHNGTIYRWNRPVYAAVDGTPHLRVENRVLPAGPSVADVMANAAFYYGLVRYLAEAQRPVWTQMAFATAAENMYTAARHGIDAQLYWPGLGEVPVTELVLRHLLPQAREGLGRWGVDPQQAGRLLGHHRAALRHRPHRRGLADRHRGRADRGRRDRAAGGAARDDPALHRPHAHQRTGAYLGREVVTRLGKSRPPGGFPAAEPNRINVENRPGRSNRRPGR